MNVQPSDANAEPPILTSHRDALDALLPPLILALRNLVEGDGSAAAQVESIAKTVRGGSRAATRWLCLLGQRLCDAELLEHPSWPTALALLSQHLGPRMYYALAVAESHRGSELGCRFYVSALQQHGGVQWRTWQDFRHTARAMDLSTYTLGRLLRAEPECLVSDGNSQERAASVQRVQGGKVVTDERARRQQSQHWYQLVRTASVEVLLQHAEERTAQGAPLNQRELTALLQATRERGTPAELIRAIEQASHFKKEADRVLLQELLCSYRRMGRCEDAHQVFAEAKQRGVQLNRYHYTSMIALCADHGDVARAEGYLAHMQADGIEPDAMLHATLIHVYGRAGQPEQAQRVFDEVERAGKAVDAGMCGALLDALGKAGQVQRSSVVFAQMQRAGLRAKSAEYGAMLLSLCHAGKITQARELLAQMQREEVSIGSAHYGALMKAYLRSQLPAEAEEVRALMRSKNLLVEHSIARLLIHAYGKLGQLEGAQRVFAEIAASGRAPDEAEYGAMLYALCRGGVPERADEMIAEMQQRGAKLNHIHLGTVIDGYARLGKLDRAEQLLTEMHRLGFSPCAIEYGSLLSGYCRAGRLPDAEKLVVRMQEAQVGLDVAHQTTLMFAYSRAGLGRAAAEQRLLLLTGSAVSKP